MKILSKLLSYFDTRAFAAFPSALNDHLSQSTLFQLRHDREHPPRCQGNDWRTLTSKPNRTQRRIAGVQVFAVNHHFRTGKREEWVDTNDFHFFIHSGAQ